MANRNTNLTKPELVKPTINGDTDVWGRKLNDNIDKQDVFNAKLIEDSESQNTELERLEKEKFDINDVEEIVYPMMDNYADTHIKPKLDEHVETVNKPNLDAYTESKKQELNKHVQDVNKVELNTYTETQKNELNTHTIEKKSELDSYTSTKKLELDTHTTEKESQLDLYEKEKEKELDSFTTTKKSEITQHTNTEKENITSHTEDKKLELDTYTNGKKEQLDNYTNEKQTQLDNYTITKQEQLDGYTTTKKEEITEHTETKKTEITSHTDSKKTELDEYEKVKESQLNTYTTIKEQQITEHTDSEIERIKATGIDGKLDKTDNRLQGTTKDVIENINESFYRFNQKQIGNTNTSQTIFELTKQSGVYASISAANKWTDLPKIYSLREGEGTNGSFSYLSFDNLNKAFRRGLLFPRYNNQIYTSRCESTDESFKWSEVLTEESRLFLGNSGITAVKYIQENAIKEAGKGYIDQTTGELYYCYKEASDNVITPSSNYFYKATNIYNAKNYKTVTNANEMNFLNSLILNNLTESTTKINTLYIPLHINTSGQQQASVEIILSTGYYNVDYSFCKKILLYNYYQSGGNLNKTQTYFIGGNNTVKLYKFSFIQKDDNINYLVIQYRGKQTIAVINIHAISRNVGFLNPYNYSVVYEDISSIPEDEFI